MKSELWAGERLPRAERIEPIQECVSHDRSLLAASAHLAEEQAKGAARIHELESRSGEQQKRHELAAARAEELEKQGGTISRQSLTDTKEMEAVGVGYCD